MERPANAVEMELLHREGPGSRVWSYMTIWADVTNICGLLLLTPPMSFELLYLNINLMGVIRSNIGSLAQ